MKHARYIPWAIAALLALLCGWTFVIYVPAAEEAAVKNVAAKHPLLDPAQSFYEKKDLVINVTPLRDDLTKIVGNNIATVYFEELNSGSNVSVNDDLALWPASLMKIPVAMAVMKKIERGEWRIDDELILTSEDKNSGYGDLFEAPTGSKFTIEELLQKMLVASDNTARSIFLRNLDTADVEDVLSHLGLDDIFNANAQVRAKKYSVFWRSLYTASYLTPEDSEGLIRIMAMPHQVYYLRQGIPADIEFSHKIGDGDGVYSDSGIVYAARRPYILTVMVRGDAASATALMKKISETVYVYVKNYE